MLPCSLIYGVNKMEISKTLFNILHTHPVLNNSKRLLNCNGKTIKERTILARKMCMREREI